MVASRQGVPTRLDTRKCSSTPAVPILMTRCVIIAGPSTGCVRDAPLEARCNRYCCQCWCLGRSVRGTYCHLCTSRGIGRGRTVLSVSVRDVAPSSSDRIQPFRGAGTRVQIPLGSPSARAREERSCTGVEAFDLLSLHAHRTILGSLRRRLVRSGGVLYGWLPERRGERALSEKTCATVAGG